MKTTYWYIIIVIVIFIGVIALSKLGQTKEDPAVLASYDSFAECLNEAGAIFYGTFWCPHCQEQKSLFKNSAKKLNYVECSTPDGQSQTEICKEEGITGYPTWKFTDGSELSGVQQFSSLAEKTNCPLP